VFVEIERFISHQAHSHRFAAYPAYRLTRSTPTRSALPISAGTSVSSQRARGPAIISFTS
jgi:hypothetical protein